KSGGGSSSSSKSGKGSSSKSSKGSSSSSDDHHWVWVGGLGSGSSDDSSSSGKSGKSGGSSGSDSGKSGKGTSSSHDDTPSNWHGGWGKPGWWGPGSSSSSSSKSGKAKSGKSGSGKSGKGSGKSGKGTSSGNHYDHWGPPPGWHSHGEWSHSHGHWHWIPNSSGKAGKSKTGKGESASSDGGTWIPPPHSSSTTTSTSTSIDVPAKPDSSSPGVCAPSFDEGGLECDVDDFDFCTEPGEQAECGSGMICYDKELCPKYSTSDPIGVCDSHGKGLDCDEVTTYCTDPGDHGECGYQRKCHDAGLCGYGGKGSEYDGVCGIAFHDSGKQHSGLDCDNVTTRCTKPGEHAECAHGSKCFDTGLCTGGKGFCSSSSEGSEVDCEDISTFCAHPDEPGQCPHGQTCYDIDICTTPTEEEETSVPTYSPTALDLMEVCIHKGEIVECWGDAAYGDGIAVPFTYTVDTDGKNNPDSVITSLENAILDDVVDHVLGNEKYENFSGKIAASPEDYIADDDWCGNGAVRCSVVKGEMNFHVDTFNLDDDGWFGDAHDAEGGAWAGDGHDDIDAGDAHDAESGAWAGDGHDDIDACDASNIIKDSMEGKDYSEVDGVTKAEYRNSDLECDGGGGTIIAAKTTFVEDDGVGAGAAFGMLMAAAALIALAFFVTRRRRRQPIPEEVMKEDISLVSGDLNGTFFSDREDPYANTIDVHKCTSIFCNCNGNLSETTFLPAPTKVNMAETMAANGISPTAVNEADNEFFEEEDELATGIPTDLEEQANTGRESPTAHDSIMRVPIRSQNEESDRPLTPVNEIAHDSEIDTELESMAGDNDETTVPPPPPLSFHPAYRQGSRVATLESDDEISI
ncbi:hypothetical protein ACHAXR_006184, partial [Thalassiosira sp. AJA248-18]